MFGTARINASPEDDIKQLPDSERVKKPISQFYLWFGANLTIADFALGFLPVIYFNLNFIYSILSLLIGTLAGGILLASMSVMGPKTGLPQMMVGKHAFGRKGGNVMSLLQWLNTTGWLTVNTIIAATALSILIYTTSGYFFVIPVIAVAVLVLLLAYFGANLIHTFEKIMSVVLGALFVYLAIFTVTNYSVPFYSGGFNLVGFASTIALSFSYIMSWGPYASDYSRYVRPESRGTFSFTLAGAVISTFAVEVVGVLVELAIPTYETAPGTIVSLMGKYAVIGLITLILGGLAANSLNLYSNSMSLKTFGIKASRKLILFVVTIISIGLSILGYANFYQYYQDFLYVLDYWITPWLGIMIVDYLLSRGNLTKVSDGYNVRTFIAYLVPIGISIPFINPISQLEGPISVLLGGVDISYFVSFSLSMLFFYILRRKDFIAPGKSGSTDS